jgi:hypothetical protein
VGGSTNPIRGGGSTTTGRPCTWIPVWLGFQRSADYRPPRWPDPERPQQFHLDIEVDDLEAAQAAAAAGGATRLDDGANFWRTYADPAGHPFCLLPGKSLSNEEKPVV